MRGPIVAALVVFLPSLALAQEADDAHRHLGFSLRMELGPAFASSSASALGVDARVSGAGGQFALSLGGAVLENFILSGNILWIAESNPDITLNGQTLSTSNTSFGLGAIGPQLTYYFMPVNLFLSGTLSVARLDSSIDGRSNSSSLGFAVRAILGKEWWVSRSWGLGLSGQFILASNPDGAAVWTTTGFSAVFSATYN